MNQLNILIVKLSAIGDLVHTLPFLEVLKKKFPQAHIDWVVEEGASDMIVGHPDIRRVIVSHRKLWLKRLRGNGTRRLTVFADIQEFIKELRAFRYDMVIDLQGILKSGVLVGLARGGRKIGMSGSREGASLFINEPAVKVDYNQHAIERTLTVAKFLGCETGEWKGQIPIFESNRHRVDTLLEERGLSAKRLVAINPIAKWDTKLWEADRFGILADKLQESLDCEIVFTGGPEDRSVIEEISSRMKKKPVNLAGITGLKDLACLYTRCKLLVTTDTGPMHMAAAMGCPTVALFGPTAPWRTGPYGQGHKVVRGNVECSPCLQKKCDDMRCMKEISVNQVYEGVMEFFEWEKEKKYDHK